MDFLTYGDSTAPAVMLIHSMATTAKICFQSFIDELSREYLVILAVLDGHDPHSDSVFLRELLKYLKGSV